MVSVPFGPLAQLPPALVNQLAPAGRMVAPIGRGEQQLVRLRRTANSLARESLLAVRFVPMVPEGEDAPL